jgi:hypothetical protein
MGNASLLLAIVVALFGTIGLLRLVLRRRRAARSLITTPSRSSRPGDQAGGDQAGGDQAGATAETDAERRERLVEQAFLAGAVPAVWYRHAKAALAAEAAEPDEPAKTAEPEAAGAAGAAGAAEAERPRD